MPAPALAEHTDAFAQALGAGRGSAAPGRPAEPAMPAEEIVTREALDALRARLGADADWTAPGVRVVVSGPAPGQDAAAGRIVIEHAGQPVATVSPALLLSWVPEMPPSAEKAKRAAERHRLELLIRAQKAKRAEEEAHRRSGDVCEHCRTITDPGALLAGLCPDCDRAASAY